LETGYSTEESAFKLILRKYIIDCLPKLHFAPVILTLTRWSSRWPVLSGLWRYTGWIHRPKYKLPTYRLSKSYRL